MKGLKIAIDGPAGAGKSTVAKAVARALDILYLDTGAMYRALGWACRQRGADPTDGEAVSDLFARIELSVRYVDGGQRVLVDGRDATDEIRTPEVAVLASQVSAHGPVRRRMVALQQQIAREHDLVMDGRDIATHVLPDAPFKFYVTASLQERARRRCEELRAKGEPADLDRVAQEVADRDRADMTRKESPLVQAPDAMLVDTTGMTIEQAADAVLTPIREAGLA